MNQATLKDFLDKKVDEYDQPSFIEKDPVLIPHLFKRKQDIEISGFFAAQFAWGNRTTIINKSRELMEIMDMSPFEFCLHHTDNDLKKIPVFKHRTFSLTDLLYFIEFFKWHYSHSPTLELAFTQFMKEEDKTTEGALEGFHHYFFSLEHAPPRTRKHVATPQRGSTCKRLNMFLRWMVRQDQKGVDFGIWEKIRPSQLVCPIDVHVARVARQFGMLKRKQTDWKAALELTGFLKTLDPSDPVKYDYALFALGIAEKFG